MEIFERFIFGGSSSTPPEVALYWNDNDGQEDRSCTYSTCYYVLKCVRTDIDNDIVTNELLLSTDGGSTWTTMIGNWLPPSGSNICTTTDSITNSGLKWYKVICTDMDGNSTESNILKMSKVQPTPGEVVIEYGGNQYAHAPIGQSPTVPINMVGSASLSWYFVNVHPTDYVQMAAHNGGNGTDSMRVFKASVGTNAPILTSPQTGETLQPNSGSQLPGAINATGLSGLYYVDLAVVNVNFQGTLTWLINIT